MAASERVTFTGSLGETLAARLDLPTGKPRAYALFAHCFSCSKDVLAASRISRGLAERGIAVLRFDFTGLGQSEGDFANTNFTSNVQDLVQAAAFLRKAHEAPSLLIGHSLGGAAVIAAAGDIPEVQALVTLGAPADADHVTHNFGGQLAEIEKTGEAEVSLGGRPFRIRKQFLDDISGRKLDDVLAGLRIPVLIAHAPRDETVGVENATRLFVAARHPKSFLSLDDADHLISNPADSAHAASVIAAWAEKYAVREALPASPRPLSEPVSAVVQETGLGGYHGWAVMGEHRVMVDEPERFGGLDGGASPYQLLSASLAACTTMTLRMYAQRKEWTLGRITTEVVHERRSQPAEGERRDLFRRIVKVEGGVTAEQAEKLVEIAGKCPVHRTLEAGADVETRSDVKIS
ncbi:MAG: bifunctional alpha/beta hydrolase/OsmC family protein [Pseudomonadota bacterium]